MTHRKPKLHRARPQLLTSVMLATRPASGANWILNADGYWSVGSNWDTGQMPINGASASIVFFRDDRDHYRRECYFADRQLAVLEERPFLRLGRNEAMIGIQSALTAINFDTPTIGRPASTVSHLMSIFPQSSPSGKIAPDDAPNNPPQ